MGIETPRRPGLTPAGWIDQQSRTFYAIALKVVGWFLRFYIRHYLATGAENIPSTGGVFVIANHTSLLDPFLLCYPISNRVLRGPGKVELFKGKYASWLLYKIGIFPLRQGGSDPAGVRTMVELYRRGECVAVFPEGGRSDTGELKPFFPDFARLAIKLHATLVPAAMAGPEEVLPVGALWPRPNVPVRVIFGEPLELSQYYGAKVTREMAEEAAQFLQDRVAALQVQARAERATMGSSPTPDAGSPAPPTDER